MRKFSFFIMLFIGFGAYSQSTEALKAYNAQNYEEAIALWNKELASPNRNLEQVFFQIGNAYFKLQDYSKSLAFYEKSLREDYNQTDLKFNIKVARAKLSLDTENKTLFTHDWIRKIAYLIPLNWLKWMVIIFSLTLFIISAVHYFKEIPYFALCKNYALIFVLFLIGLFFLQNYFKSEKGFAIISKQTIGFENASMKGKSKPIHEGEKVEIVDEIGNTAQVKTEADTKYWIEKANFYII